MSRLVKSRMSQLLGENKRLDGRKHDEYRKPVKVELNITKTAEGSARVFIGETVVLAGVKMELGKPYPDTPDEGSIMVGAELLALANPDFEPGPPGIQATELARVVDRGIRESKALDFKGLCITPGELCWIVVIDIVPVNDAGNLFDASALAAIAAIKCTKLPKRDGDVLDYKSMSNKGLPMSGYPISLTVGKLGNNYLVDMDSDEEKVIDARLSVAYLEDGTLCAMQKGGDHALAIDDVMAMIELGWTKSAELREALENAQDGKLADE